jgi:hypothetical protein
LHPFIGNRGFHFACLLRTQASYTHGYLKFAPFGDEARAPKVLNNNNRG